jgi:hypothetical protein
MSHFRKTELGRAVFLKTYWASLIASSCVFGLGEALTIAVPQLSSRWLLSAAFMLLLWAMTHMMLFILVGGPIVYIIAVLVDELSGDRLLGIWPKILVGAALGILLSPVCLLPFVPLQEPDDPSYFARWVHYLPLMVLAGALGAFCFGWLIDRTTASIRGLSSSGTENLHKAGHLPLVTVSASAINLPQNSPMP